MSMYIVTTILIAHLMFVNAGFIVYSAINWYSYLQLKLAPGKKKVLDTNEAEDTMDYLVRNCLIKANDTDNALDEINKADFAVLVSKGSNMVCFYPPLEQYNPEYELSDIQFISVKVMIDSVEHNVRLKTPEYSFYIAGNELNSKWVRYYFIKYLGIELPSDVKYEMTIIDDNVQFVVINENQSIIINKDSYDVFDYLNKEEESDSDLGEDDDQDEDIDEDQDQNLNEDPNELGLDRMIELEKEIKKEIQQQQQQPPLEDDLDMDNMIDKMIADYDMSNIEIFSRDNVALVDASNNLLLEQVKEHEKTQGWFNLF